ncbi:MAG: hypothetical protein AAGE38_11750 [Pseudomonadota bacterium]
MGKKRETVDAKAADKAERLAQALRDNLKRRKAQARSRKPAADKKAE